jgi:Cupin domain
VTTLFSRDLSDIPGKEGTMLIVEYPPGGADPVHRHNANAFVYVLEGSVITQVKESEPVPFTLVKPSMKVPMTFTLSVATPAKRSPRSFSSSSLRTRVRPS